MAILTDLPDWVAFPIAVGLFVVGMVQAGLRWAAQNATVPVGDVVAGPAKAPASSLAPRTTRWPRARSCASSAAAVVIASPIDRPYDEAPPPSLQGSAGALLCVQGCVRQTSSYAPGSWQA